MIFVELFAQNNETEKARCKIHIINQKKIQLILNGPPFILHAIHNNKSSISHQKSEENEKKAAHIHVWGSERN